MSPSEQRRSRTGSALARTLLIAVLLLGFGSMHTLGHLQHEAHASTGATGSRTVEPTPAPHTVPTPGDTGGGHGHGSGPTVECEHRPGDGHAPGFPRFWYDMWAAEGQVVEILGVSRDISERREAEAQIQASLMTHADFREAYARFSSRSFETDVSLLLARFKRREYVRIMLRDVLSIATLAETTAEISALSDVLIEEALREGAATLCARYGGAPQHTDAQGRLADTAFSVLSLGKLGGNELNYSSDVDLLYLYGDANEAGGVSISAREYFVRLAQQVTEILGRVTAEGAFDMMGNLHEWTSDPAGTFRGGRPRSADLRATLNGILYLNRTGCAWRMLPHEFPPWSTVHYYYRTFRRNGVWQDIHDRLREQVRVEAGKQKTPSAAIIDSQSVKTAEKGGAAGTMRERKSPAESGISWSIRWVCSWRWS